MNTLTHVFKKPSSSVIATLAGVLVLFLIVLIPKYQALGLIWGTAVPLGIKLSLSLGEMLLFFRESVLTVVLGVLTAIVFGINVALAVFYMRFRRLRIKEAGVSGIAAAVAMLGFGCGTCGSVILASVLGAFGSSLVAFLPLGGAEFGIVGLALLLYATWRLARAIDSAGLCEVTK